MYRGVVSDSDLSSVMATRNAAFYLVSFKSTMDSTAAFLR